MSGMLRLRPRGFRTQIVTSTVLLMAFVMIVLTAGTQAVLEWSSHNDSCSSSAPPASGNSCASAPRRTSTTTSLSGPRGWGRAGWSVTGAPYPRRGRRMPAKDGGYGPAGPEGGPVTSTLADLPEASRPVALWVRRGAVAVLARGEITYATGNVLHVDGGLTLRKL